MYNLPKESDPQKISEKKYISIKLRSFRKLSTNRNNQTQRTSYHIKKRKKFTYGTNLSANYTLMIVVDSPLNQEVEISTS